MTAALSLRYLRVQYGKTVALDNVSLDIHVGEIVALLGPNGSGKSSALAVAAGLINPFAGSAFAGGIARSAEPKTYARMIGFVPQEPALYDELSARENLLFFGRLYGLGGTQRAQSRCRGRRGREQALERDQMAGGGLQIDADKRRHARRADVGTA